jgi:hypothetical protein
MHKTSKLELLVVDYQDLFKGGLDGQLVKIPRPPPDDCDFDVPADCHVCPLCPSIIEVGDNFRVPDLHGLAVDIRCNEFADARDGIVPGQIIVEEPTSD